MKRRSRGHVLQRSKGSYTVVLALGRDPSTGKRRQQWLTVKGTKRDAERKLTELLHEIDNGGFVNSSKSVLGDFLRQWLDTYAATNVRARTLEGYSAVIDRHLIPQLGRIPLSELQPGHLQAYYARALSIGRLDGQGGLSARSVLQHHRVLSEALSHAVKWGHVARNVAQAVDPPQARRKETATLDADGIRRLLDAAQGTIYYPLIHLALFTGLRRSELLGLRWQDLDLNRGTLSVSQVMHHLRDGRIVYEEPKTEKSRRLVALSPVAVLALRGHRDRQEGDRDMLGMALDSGSLVFGHADGSPLLPNTVTHAFIKIVRRAGLGGVRLHDLRHTHASVMLRQGVHPKIVQERLGHSSISITLDVYSHVVPGLQEAAALQFEQELAEPIPSAVG